MRDPFDVHLWDPDSSADNRPQGDYANGTFADYYVGKESYLHKIPDSIPSEYAAPLQCAGSTVYTALSKNVTSKSRVGIIGIGGLGHLAIQFAAKMGAEVAVFSTKADKEAEARSFGATEFYLLGETDKVKAPLDVLILAASKSPDWSKFLGESHFCPFSISVPSLRCTLTMFLQSKRFSRARA